MKRRLLLTLAVLIPLGLFVTARQAASWRPEVLANVSYRSPVLVFSPDSRYLITQNNPMVAGDALWDVNARRMVRGFPEGPLYVISPDSRTLAVVGGTFVTDTGLMPPSGSDWSGIAFGASVRFFDLQSGRPLREFSAPERLTFNQTQSAAFSPDGKSFVIATQRVFYRFDAATGRLQSRAKPRRVQPGFKSYNLALSPDTKRLLRDSNGRTEIFDLANAGVERGLVLPGSSRNGAGWSPDGRICWQRLPTNQGFRFWNAQTGELIRDWQTQSRVHFTPDSKHLAVARINRLELRDVLTGKLVQTLPGPRAEPFQIAPDGSFAVSVEGGKLLRWRLR